MFCDMKSNSIICYLESACQKTNIQFVNCACLLHRKKMKYF